MLKEYINTLQNKYNHCIKMTSFERIYYGLYKSEVLRKGISKIMNRMTYSKSFKNSRYIDAKSHYYPGFDKELNKGFIDLYRVDEPNYPLFRVYENGEFKMMNKNITNYNIKIINHLMRKLDFNVTNIRELEKTLVV